jgi:hypothetical protein
MASRPPKSLVTSLKESRCVLFAGSGLSKWADLPTWTELLTSMVQELKEELDEEQLETLAREELDSLIAKEKLLEVADYCKENLTDVQYNTILSRHLRGTDCDIPEPHKIIVDLPFSAIVTTNFDKLLEQAYIGVKRSWPHSPTHRDADLLGTLLYDNSFFLLKAHGDIDRPSSMVLTAPDYQEIIHSNPAFNAVFSAILLTKSILFVGYSLSDPDFRLLLDWQFTTFKGAAPQRYALMRGIGKIERDVLWRTARIRVLPYDDHDEVLQFLRQLRRDYLNDALASTA